jgi:hypothetical protein
MQRPTLVKTETAEAALTVTVVEMLASVVAVVMADSNGDGSQNRVSSGSRGDSGYGTAENNRNCGGRQVSTKFGSGSGRDSGCGSGNRSSVAAMAGRVGIKGLCWQHWQQWLSWWQTTTEMVGSCNNLQNAAAVAAAVATVVLAMAIVAAWWQQ